MAINSTYCDRQLQASYAMSSRGNGSVQSQLKAKSYISSISANSKYRRRRSKNSNNSMISNDTMHLHPLAENDGSRKYQSSFQLAAKLYKSNSDELKLKKKVSKKSNKKSVLTLPNEPTVLPQSCTVSDMNDTEYLKSINKPKVQKTKKRLPKKRLQPPNLEYEYYDRDADYCSQMNAYLNCSSVDVVKNFKGDGKRKTRCAHSAKSKTETDDSTPSDVWTVLRNINRFQFQSSPPMSDDSTFDEKPRKKKILKKKINRGVYETCRTEQIAYFSNIELKVPTVPRDCSASGSSQTTVIDNRNKFDISEEVEKTFDIYAPLMNANSYSANSTKSQVKSKRITNSTQPITSSKKKSASKDTLAGLKSEVSLKPVEKCSEHYDSFGEPRKENVCTAVEVQTENFFEQKEEFDQYKTNTGTLNGATMNENLDEHRNVKASLYRPLSRVPGRSAPAHLKRSPEHQLITTPNALASVAGRPLITAPSKTSSVNRWLSMGPKTVANSTSRPLTYVSPKTVARFTGSALSTITSNNALGPASRPLLMVPSKTITSPPDRSITIASYKTVADPVSLTFSKLQDCPRKSMQMVTQSDIRSIVAKLKFPLVILGKDQVSGTFEVEEYDHPQFKGLDKHVWPFMIDWVSKPREIEAATHCKNKIMDKTFTITGANPSQCNKKEQMRKANPEVKQSKVKPTSRFRDNMLKLLYKKASHSHQNIVKVTPGGRVQRDVRPVSPVKIRSNNTNTNKCKTVDTASSCISFVPPRIVTSPKTLRQIISPSRPPRPTSPSKIMIAPKFHETKPIWDKAKRASDFIENIFKKIKNGTYYTSEIKSKNKKVPLQNRTCDTNDLKQIINDSKEVSIQVSIVPEDFIPKITIQKKKEFPTTLPGFDDVVPQLEIKSMTRNQIAVRHCITNILLQFDVNMPPEEADRTLPFKRSMSFETLPVTENKTKVFKCKTRILNAILPAELCSIIPKVLMQCLVRETPRALTLQEEKRKSSLSTISENIISDISERVKLPLLPQIEMLPELSRLRNGRFSKNPKSWTEKSSSNENFYIISVNELPYQHGNREAHLLLRPLIALHYYYYIGQPSQMLVPHSTKPEPTPTLVPHTQNSSPDTNLCTALVPYTGNTMMFGECTNKIQTAPIVAFKELFKMMLKSNISCMSEYFPTIQLRTSNNHVYVNSFIGHHQRLIRSGGGDCTILSINATNVKLQSLYNVSSNSFRAIEDNRCTEKQIEYIKRARPNELNKTEKIKPLSNGEISKRKGHARYVKLYKKCKSTSHIATERSSTPLCKVTNLDEFFQALGAGKMLSCAVDGRCGSKIMSSVSDLKSYITEITPRQALLVMLLANKKDTLNLVRFRAMILQGIAVNRITRVSELDMEVQVIEKERFKMPEYLDKSPVAETTEYNDNLLEELYWIAKTTSLAFDSGEKPTSEAADHQRRFDKSSEKLLKALLEKRKRLNPSYLRVMARYVGLGLLKKPVNH